MIPLTKLKTLWSKGKYYISFALVGIAAIVVFFVLKKKDKAWDMVQKIKDNPPPVKEKPKVNIQDRLRQKADIAIADLEEQVDDIFMSDFQEKPSPLPILVKYQLKPMHLKFVIEWANEAMEDWVEALEPDDPQIKEAYEHTTKTKKKKMIAYYESVKECCEKIKSLTKKKSSVKIKIR